MGYYDGAEVCELVGSYMLNQFKHTVNKESIGLYRDDDLRIFHKIPKPGIGRKKKQIVKRVWILYHHSVQFEIGRLFRCYF